MKPELAATCPFCCAPPGELCRGPHPGPACQQTVEGGTVPCAARSPRSRWQDAYRIGQRVTVLVCGEWIPGKIFRKTATGFPVVTMAFRRGLVAYVIDRKGDIGAREVAP